MKNAVVSIDGDLVEMFLELEMESQQKIVTMVNTELKTVYSVTEILDYLQDIRSKHSYVCYKQFIVSTQRNQSWSNLPSTIPTCPQLRDDYLSYLPQTSTHRYDKDHYQFLGIPTLP